MVCSTGGVSAMSDDDFTAATAEAFDEVNKDLDIGIEHVAKLLSSSTDARAVLVTTIALSGRMDRVRIAALLAVALIRLATERRNGSD